MVSNNSYLQTPNVSLFHHQKLKICGVQLFWTVFIQPTFYFDSEISKSDGAPTAVAVR